MMLSNTDLKKPKFDSDSSFTDKEDSVYDDTEFEFSPPPRQEPQEPLIETAKFTALLITTAGIAFVAARNTITWYAQAFWGASGDFWQAIWSRIYHMVDGDEFIIGFVMSALWPIAVFWLYNLFFMYVDYSGRPAAIVKYKIQPTVNVPCPPHRFWAAVRRVLYNQFIWGIPFMYLGYHLMKLRGNSLGEELPTFHWVLAELAVFALIEEVGFYYSHRLLHTPFFYKRVHKVHHEWQTTISLVSLYAHPFEHVLSNMIPIFTGPFLCGSHVTVFWLWFSIGIFSASVAHCGYHLPFLQSPEAHDFHHAKFNNNFGTLGILDRLHGTDEAFRKTKAYERHVLLLSFVPMREQIPDVGSEVREAPSKSVD